jgi:phosphoglycerol transferase MdoB-like AlkP superfamily enzyme
MRTIVYFLRLILFWLTVFIAAKVYFLTVNADSLNEVIAVFKVWFHGFRLDLSVVGYISIIPLLICVFHKWFPKLMRSINRTYWKAIWIIIALILAVDPFFYYYWGQKTNLGFLQFLGKENAGFASIELKTYVITIAFFLVTTFWFWKKGVRYLRLPYRVRLPFIPVLLGLCFLFIRSGVGKVPINISSAYFTENPLYNNAAANAVWSFLSTELERDKHAALSFMSDDEMTATLAQLPKSVSDYTSLITPSKNPNIVLIVLESFSAKLVGSLSGDKYAATPELDAIMAEGIRYDSAYAASFRSDKGLLALTQGVPSGARQTLTNFPEKLSKIPNVFRSFNDDYHTRFFYGGNLEFANIKVLFSAADEVRSEGDFSTTVTNAWGAHDEVVFDEFTKAFLREDKPQFAMLFSLSSHEPIDVPSFAKLENKYLNSVAYTDSCLGVMIRTLKTSEKWKNTIVILTADHGTIRPDNAPIYSPVNFRIPIAITGGLVKRDTVVREIVSQLDIPSTINYLANRSFPDNTNTLLEPKGNAFYSYFNGLTYIGPDCTQHYDIGYGKYVADPCGPLFEKAFFQRSNAFFFSR